MSLKGLFVRMVFSSLSSSSYRNTKVALFNKTTFSLVIEPCLFQPLHLNRAWFPRED